MKTHYICDLESHDTIVKEVEISRNHLNSVSARNILNRPIQSIILSLSGIVNLTEIDISQNNIGDYSEIDFDLFIDSVGKCKRLRKLIADFNRFTEAHFDKLINLANSLPKLEHFSLRSNMFGAVQSNESMLQLIRDHPNIKTISIAGSGLGRDVLQLVHQTFVERFEILSDENTIIRSSERLISKFELLNALKLRRSGDEKDFNDLIMSADKKCMQDLERDNLKREFQELVEAEAIKELDFEKGLVDYAKEFAKKKDRNSLIIFT